MKMIKIILLLYLIFLNVFLVNATTIQMSNLSSEYLLCIYNANGYFVGCANNTHPVSISKSDYILQLTFPEKNLLDRPLTIFSFFGTILFIGLILMLVTYIIFRVFLFGSRR